MFESENLGTIRTVGKRCCEHQNRKRQEIPVGTIFMLRLPARQIQVCGQTVQSDRGRRRIGSRHWSSREKRCG